MDLQLSNTALIFLGMISCLFIVLNLWLLSAWQNRKKPNNDWATRLRDGLRDPWHNEDAKLKELSQRVSELRSSHYEEHEEKK